MIVRPKQDLLTKFQKKVCYSYGFHQVLTHHWRVIFKGAIWYFRLRTCQRETFWHILGSLLLLGVEKGDNRQEIHVVEHCKEEIFIGEKFAVCISLKAFHLKFIPTSHFFKIMWHSKTDCEGNWYKNGSETVVMWGTFRPLGFIGGRPSAWTLMKPQRRNVRQTLLSLKHSCTGRVLSNRPER